METQTTKTDKGDLLGVIIITPILVAGFPAIIIVAIMASPLVLFESFMDKLFGVKEEPVDESIWYQSGGRGTIF
ncbi:MAG: hypothetical protein ACFFH0_09755 [Promethearchaeota archaeon]